jgi:hypothetical protein
VFKKFLTWYLVTTMFIIGIAPRVEASFAPSQSMAFDKPDRNTDMQKIQAILETKVVKQRLQDFGFSEEEIKNRLSQLSDQQLHKLALNLDELKVGKDDALGVIIALLVIAILVVLLLKLTGHNIVITKKS